MKALLSPISLSLWMLGCAGGGSGGGSDYTLSVKPLVPRNQTGLFSEFDSLSMELQFADGTVDSLALDQLGTDSTSELGDLPALEQTRLALLGMDPAGDTIAIGHSEPLSLSTGSEAISILVSRVNSIAELAPLSEGRMGAELVAVGDGVFLLFGGSVEYADDPGSINPVPSGSASISELRLGSLSETMSFEIVGEMPPRDEDAEGCEEHACDRVNFTATRLSASHPDSGKILVMGGAYDYLGSTQVTASGFLWDPETHTAEVLTGSDSQFLEPTFFHTATEDSRGNIVFAGGSTSSTQDLTFSPRTRVEIYDPFTRELSLAGGTPVGDLIWHSAARLGEDGVLLCGGTSFSSSSAYPLLRTCDLIETTGDFLALDEAQMLPIGLVHHQMTTLADGRVLVTGGFAAEGDQIPVDSSGMLSALASNRAFVTDGQVWTETGPMAVARGGHGATLLADGRVFIAGGEAVTDNLFPDGFDAIACAEIFDPETFEFTPVSDCTETSSSGDLPMATAFPSVAADPIHGALIVGGMDSQSTDGVALFTLPPAE